MKKVFLVALLAAGCHAKEEARAVVTAVDAFRSAPNDDKPAKADALDKVPCTDSEVCEVKAACAKSADATAHGIRLEQEIEQASKDGARNGDEMQSKFKQAQVDLEEGYGLLEGCRLKTQALREKYSL